LRYVPNVVTTVVKEKLPADPNVPFWRAVPSALVPLGPQMEIAPHWSQPAIDSVDVVAAANADELGIMLAWDDPSRDVQSGDTQASSVVEALKRHGTWRFPDAIAVQFPDKLDGKETLPPVYLGDATHPVRRWLWTADRDDQGQREALVQRIAGPDAAPVPTSDLGPVRTIATYADGQWRLLLLAKRPPKSVTTIPIALQAWDGAAGETGHWHSLSGWVNLSLR
jgi:DMSO reductase family type II enzyme heme b subunit